MKIRNCIKRFTDDAISKVIPPARTCAIVFNKLRKVSPPIHVRHFPVKRPSGIPQYFVQGTKYFRKIANQAGTNGKGHTEEQALASGLMEFAERYSCRKFFLSQKPLLSSFGALRDNPYRLHDVYSHFPDNRNARVLAGKEAESVKVRWYRGSTLQGGAVYLPVPLLGFMVLGTNGMAAGNSLEEALLHGICEVAERHLKALIETEKRRTPTVVAATINSPVANALLQRFISLGHEVQVKDFSLGCGLPAVGVIRQINKSDCVITAGVAASRGEALVRALTESSQGEGSLEENHRKTSEIRHLLSRTKSIPWSAVPDIHDDNIKVELTRAERLLKRSGMKVFFVDTTEPGLGIPSVYVVIAGAKIWDARFAHRNILNGLINESLWLDDGAAADRLIDVALKADPRNRHLYWVDRAISLRRRSRYKESIGYFEKYLSLKKNSLSLSEDQRLRPVCWLNLGICNLALKRSGKATGCFREFAAIQGDFNLVEMRAVYESIPSLAKDSPLLDHAERIIRRIKEAAR